MSQTDRPDVSNPAGKQEAPAPFTLHLDAKAKQRMEAYIQELNEKMKPLFDEIEDSERLSEKDYSIRINTRA